MAEPIWKDHDVDLGTTDAQVYYIFRNAPQLGDQLFSGRAFIRPGATHAYTRINEICADYLYNELPDPTIWDLLGPGDPLSPVTVPLAVDFQTAVPTSGGGYNVKDNTIFEYNWSHRAGLGALAGGWLHEPIRREIDLNAPLILSKTMTDVGDNPIISFAGTSVQYTVAQSASCNLPLAIPAAARAVDLRDEEGETVLTLPIVNRCTRYILYYVNAIGGWDTLLIDGRAEVSDGITRHEYTQRYDNGTPDARGRVDYANEVTRNWTFNTGWLTDDEASRMFHLLESPLVYVYDTAAALFHPIVLTDTDCKFKTYQGEGRKLVQYAIAATLARDIVRR